MEKALKWFLPVLVLVEVALVWTGALGLRDATLVVIALEALLLIVGGHGLFVALRRYRAGRTSSLDRWRAAEDGLAVLLPRTAARFVVNEPRLFVCLFRWMFRRNTFADNEFGYHKRSLLRAMVPLVIFASPTELLFVHLLAHAFSPWPPLKWVLLALGIYAAFWLLGLYASLVTLPHRLEETGLRLRYGVLAEGFISYEGIQATERKDRKTPDSGEGVHHVPEEDALYLAVGGKTAVTLRLNAPQTIGGLLRASGPASTIHLAVDDPREFLSHIDRRIGERATVGSSASA